MIDQELSYSLTIGIVVGYEGGGSAREEGGGRREEGRSRVLQR